MRILMIHNYYAERGGEDAVFETESKLLKQNGQDIQTLSFNNRRLKLLKFLLYPFNIVSFLKISRKIQQFKPDVVHFHNWHFSASFSSLLACRLFGVPMVQTLHNYRLICPTGTLFYKRSIYLRSIRDVDWNAPVHDKVYRDSSVQTLWVWLVSKYFKRLGLYKAISRYIVLTPSAKEMFMETHFKAVEDRFVVKSNFLENKKHVEGKRKPYFLFVGRLTNDKGINVLLCAFKGLDYDLKIVGDGPLRPEVEKVIARHKNIEFLGFQKFPVIEKMMKECSATIFPSVSYEGMPMTIIESYANGCPIIASNFSAMRTMVVDGVTGLHFKMGSVEDLRAKIQSFATLDEASKAVYHRNVRTEYELKYTPEVNLQKLISIYKGAINTKLNSSQRPSFNVTNKINHKANPAAVEIE